MTKHYNVEFLHVYSDETFDAEHVEGARVARELLKTLPRETSTTVLIDNYNPSEKQFDIDAFLSTAAQHDISVDTIGLEADLAQYKDTVLNMITDRKLHKQYQRYIAQHQKIPCSFLTATWYLLRLGVLPLATDHIISRNDKAFTPATNLINVLPHRFRPTEDRAFTILQNSPHAHLLDAIQNIYHDSPKVHHPSLLLSTAQSSTQNVPAEAI